MTASNNHRLCMTYTYTQLRQMTVAVACALGACAVSQAAEMVGLKTAVVQSTAGQGAYLADASIEAVRDTQVASQVPARITEVLVKAGDRVKAGQVLVRMDPSAAAQQVSGSQAQVAQAQAILAAAKGDFERAQTLYKQSFLSKAAFDQAQAQFKAAQAQAQALSAQAAGSSVQAAYYTVRASYAGWVSQVHANVGDMASPGVPLLAMYDPAALRASVQVPESVVAQIDTTQAAQITLPHAPTASQQQWGVRTTVLPAVDAATHSTTVRVDMSPQTAAVVPGQFVRVRLPLKAGAEALSLRVKLMVPSASVVERGELTAVYVVSAKGEARLRQVRVGRSMGEQTEVLAGLQSGERVALDPVAAAQATAAR